MRVQAWEAVNSSALVSTVADETSVLLRYAVRPGDRWLEELQQLVAAENDCCGAAGVRFDLRRHGDEIHVQVLTRAEGLPARTVIAAFAAMKGSDGQG